MSGFIIFRDFFPLVVVIFLPEKSRAESEKNEKAENLGEFFHIMVLESNLGFLKVILVKFARNADFKFTKKIRDRQSNLRFRDGNFAGCFFYAGAKSG